jgi:DNA-binding CsgD family transcriptional regulator/tetratricopeptide (TPR) repeat protein
MTGHELSRHKAPVECDDCAMASVTDISPALLERAAELAALRGGLDDVIENGAGRVLALGGEAGAGKTALVRQFLAESAGAARILGGACEPLFTPRPLGPLLDLARECGGELEAVVAGGALPYEVAAALMRELAAHAPSVLVLEDAHWADEATLDVLRLLARRIETVPALVIASYRDDELDAAHPLRIVLGELATSSRLGRVKLRRLSPGAVAELAEPHGVDPVELHRTTAGNPFFVTEALAAEADGIPETVRDAVLARAARLGPPARALVEAVAVVPPSAELWLLEAIAGEVVSSLDECIASGMLTAEPAGIAFRHELARLTIEEAIAPDRRIALHRRALAALAEPPAGGLDPARLAHHAEAAGDAGAVLRYAPQAAERASVLGSYREAAAQHARTLRFGDRLTDGERADVLEARSAACYLADDNHDAIEAAESALVHRRRLGQSREAGDTMRWLSNILWCPGRTAESQRTARESVALLETLPPGRELANAYANLGARCACAVLRDEAILWSERGLELAERLGDAETAIRARMTIGSCVFATEGSGILEECLELAREEGLLLLRGEIYSVLGAVAAESRRLEYAPLVDEGLAYCSERGLELYRLYLLAHRARMELHAGRWEDAALSAAAVLRTPRSSISPRILALVVLALVRARRGDPGAHELLDEAWALAQPSGELPRLAPVAAARAETAWLEGDAAAVAAATDEALALARGVGSELECELVDWRRRAGLGGAPAHGVDRWRALGCPYEAALALADLDDEASQRRALDELHALGARPAGAIVARRLRGRGARDLPRGPRPGTRENPAGLTSRELEVLELLAAGLKNVEIASKLVLSPRTVEHHVAAILRKLDVGTRAAAAGEAARLGLTAAENR